MVKIFIGISLVVISTILGKSFTDKYKKRLNYYEKIKEFNNKLKRNIYYKQDSLLKLLDVDSKNDNFNQTLKSYKLYLYSGDSIEDIYLPDFLEEDDKLELINYFNSLGKNSVLSELEFNGYYEEQFNEKLCKIRDKNSRFSNLGQKLGFSFGLVVFILIL